MNIPILHTTARGRYVVTIVPGRRQKVAAVHCGGRCRAVGVQGSQPRRVSGQLAITSGDPTFLLRLTRCDTAEATRGHDVAAQAA